MAKWIFNDSGSQKTWVGQVVNDQAYYQIQPQEETKWSNDDNLLSDIGSGDAIVSKTDSSGGHFGVADGINHLKDLITQEIQVTQQPPFAAKTIGDKSLFSRVAGKEFSLSVGSNELLYTVPFAQMKFNGVEVINSEIGDKIDLYVLDDISGTYSGTPSLTLNQFGYSVFLTEGYFERQSNYDADLYLGMRIKIVYTSITAKDLYVNYILHELK